MTAYTSTGEITFSFRHEQFAEPIHGPNGHDAKAFTMCILRVNNERSFIASSWCSWSDAFNKETGRKIALKKALDLAKLSREDRREVWMSYFSRRALDDHRRINTRFTESFADLSRFV